MTSQCDGFDVLLAMMTKCLRFDQVAEDEHECYDDAQLSSATTSSQTKHYARHLLQVSQMWTTRMETDTRKALAKAIRSCRTQSRDKLFVTANVLWI